MSVINFKELFEMSYKPTDEQAAIVDGARTGENMKIEAGAGAGKTSTLRLISEAKYNDSGIAFAYNKAIADDMKATFPRNTYCSTAHSLAYRAVGKKYAHRLNGPRIPARQTARILRIEEPLTVGDKQVAITQLARIVMDTVTTFSHSDSTGIRRYHVPGVNGIVGEARDELEAFVLPLAEKAWQDIIYVDGELRFDHDHYLKIWGLTNPQLQADFIMLDEAQDANPVIRAVVEGQKDAQRILVGDANQAIYGWRGAANAMREFSGMSFQLSQSFRFGPAIAEEANKWLRYLGSDLTLRGFDAINSTVVELDAPKALLCRTNAGAMVNAIASLGMGKRVAIVGGGESIRRLAVAAEDLRRGMKTDHPELFMFDSWDEVLEYVREGEGADLQPFVKMVEDLGTQAIINACSALSDERDADIVISTAHKSKGREWSSAQIANDFRQPKDENNGIDEAEAMLAYVSVTRAKEQLDRAGLAWVDGLLASSGR